MCAAGVLLVRASAACLRQQYCQQLQRMNRASRCAGCSWDQTMENSLDGEQFVPRSIRATRLQARPFNPLPQALSKRWNNCQLSQRERRVGRRVPQRAPGMRGTLACCFPWVQPRSLLLGSCFAVHRFMHHA